MSDTEKMQKLQQFLSGRHAAETLSTMVNSGIATDAADALVQLGMDPGMAAEVVAENDRWGQVVFTLPDLWVTDRLTAYPELVRLVVEGGPSVLGAALWSWAREPHRWGWATGAHVELHDAETDELIEPPDPATMGPVERGALAAARFIAAAVNHDLPTAHALADAAMVDPEPQMLRGMVEAVLRFAAETRINMRNRRRS